jgi:FkbM family methyltransferase
MKKTYTNLKNYIRGYAPKILSSTESYSQFGEDLIVRSALTLIKGGGPFKYIDIGANDPYRLSNTALLYNEGSSGVLIEPNPNIVKKIKSMRGNRDVILNCGVDFTDKTEAEFYLIEPDVLSTFSKKEAENYKLNGYIVTKVIKVKLRNINDILKEVGEVDFLSLDVEGLDFEILKSINWDMYRPTCICVETLSFETVKEPMKNKELLNFMNNKNYRVHADTFVNTIFIENEIWMNRFR